MKMTIAKGMFTSKSSVASYSAAFSVMGVNTPLDDSTLIDLTKGKLEFMELGIVRKEPLIRSSSVDLPSDSKDSIAEAIVGSAPYHDVVVYAMDRTGPYFVVIYMANKTYVGALYSQAKVK